MPPPLPSDPDSILPALQVITDIDEEAGILEWAKSPTALGLETLHASGSEVIPTETQIDDDRSLAMIPTSTERSLSLPTVPVTDRTPGYVHLSGASRMDNSGNTYTLINNYFKDGDTTSKTSFTAVQSAAHQQETMTSPVTASAYIGSSASESSRSSFSSASARPTSPHGSNRMSKYSANFTMEREDGCYVESVTALKGNIPFHSDTAPHIKAYMSSSFSFGDCETLIPLWKPRPRQFPIEMTDVGMIGDVGYFDAEGGFYALFNIFLTEEENETRGYSPPAGFKEYSNFQVRTDIIRSLKVDPSESLSQGWVDYAVHGKFRHVKQVGSSRLSFRSEALVTNFSHGSVIAYHNSIQGILNEKHAPARKEYIQRYLNGHAAQWYNHYNIVRGQRPPLKSGHLMLVHTSWSTDSWASAVFLREDKWELGTYFADLYPYSSRQPDAYAWKAHDSVRTKTCHPEAGSTPERSDYCIAVGVNSIFTGDPPGHTRSKMRRGLHSLSQSFSSISISSTISNSVASMRTITKRGKK